MDYSENEDRSIGIHRRSRWCLSNFYIVFWLIHVTVYVVIFIMTHEKTNLEKWELAQGLFVQVVDLFFAFAIWSWAKEGDKYNKVEVKIE